MMLTRALWASIGMIALFMIAGCAARMPYQEHAVESDKAMVYVYRPISVYGGEMLYDIVIADEIRGRVDDSSYFPVPVDPGSVDITLRNSDVILGSIEYKTIRLDDVQSGGVYYIKADLSREDAFDAMLVENSAAEAEIKKTFLYDSTANDVNLRQNSDALKAVPVKSTPSSIEEIERLFELKQKGALSEEEYEKMKAKIIAE